MPTPMRFSNLQTDRQSEPERRLASAHEFATLLRPNLSRILALHAMQFSAFPLSRLVLVVEKYFIHDLKTYG
jgi:hypothetical protein